jgi:hypothetical protein
MTRRNIPYNFYTLAAPAHPTNGSTSFRLILRGALLQSYQMRSATTNS